MRMRLRNYIRPLSVENEELLEKHFAVLDSRVGAEVILTERIENHLDRKYYPFLRILSVQKMKGEITKAEFGYLEIRGVQLIPDNDITTLIEKTIKAANAYGYLVERIANE